MEAMVLVSWLRENGYAPSRVHHIANEGKRPDPRTMQRLKGEGFSPGFMDYVIASFNAGPLFLELKRIGEEPSPEQRAWIATLASTGAHAAWCQGATDAIQWIKNCEIQGRPDLRRH
jgi:hypothetical protein